jgi:hypothetical protein
MWQRPLKKKRTLPLLNMLDHCSGHFPQGSFLICVWDTCVVPRPFGPVAIKELPIALQVPCGPARWLEVTEQSSIVTPPGADPSPRTDPWEKPMWLFTAPTPTANNLFGAKFLFFS